MKERKYLPCPDAKSWCSCDHLGDGLDSQHVGLQGQGPCKRCACQQFTWARWTAQGKEFIEARARQDAEGDA